MPVNPKQIIHFFSSYLISLSQQILLPLYLSSTCSYVFEKQRRSAHHWFRDVDDFSHVNMNSRSVEAGPWMDVSVQVRDRGLYERRHRLSPRNAPPRRGQPSGEISLSDLGSSEHRRFTKRCDVPDDGVSGPRSLRPSEHLSTRRRRQRDFGILPSASLASWITSTTSSSSKCTQPTPNRQPITVIAKIIANTLIASRNNV